MHAQAVGPERFVAKGMMVRAAQFACLRVVELSSAILASRMPA
jgi:hypothetical protein